MGLDRAILERLRAAASGFVTKNHGTYLAEALQCTDQTKDPVEALRLLHAMWGSSYGSRPDQKIALNDVGKWLEARLHLEPSASADAIALELGWLRRLARIAEDAKLRENGHDRRPPGAPVPLLAFGKRIARIEEMRSAALARVEKVRVVAAPKPAPPPPPDKLPSAFEAEFVDFADARQARKKARERQQSGKPSKERLLAIRPTDPQLVSLAAGLVCSVTATQGFDAPFETSQLNGGAPCSFYVTAIEEQDGKRLARTIAMSPPQPRETLTVGSSG